MTNDLINENKTYSILKLLPPNEFATRFTDNNSIGMHAHDFFEIFYVIMGSATHTIDGITNEISIGDAYIICPGTIHGYNTTNCDNKFAHRDIMISEQEFKLACNYLSENAYTKFTENKYTTFTLSDSEIAFFENCSTKITETSNIDIYNNYKKAITIPLISIAYSNLFTTTTNSFKSKCLQALNDNFSYHDAVDRIRKTLFYNKNYLCKKFKKSFNITLVDYINNLRIERAKNLILTTNYSISQIAQLVGIDSMPYFIKLFYKSYGCSPSSFRNKTTIKK